MSVWPPEEGSVWIGCGWLVRVLYAHECNDGMIVLRLTGNGRLLKRPRERMFVVRSVFESGQMVPTTVDEWLGLFRAPKVPALIALAKSGPAAATTTPVRLGDSGRGGASTSFPHYESEADVSEHVWRISADAAMYSLAALTTDEAGEMAARILAEGASNVTIERVPAATTDPDDAWGMNRLVGNAK